MAAFKAPPIPLRYQVLLLQIAGSFVLARNGLIAFGLIGKIFTRKHCIYDTLPNLNRYRNVVFNF